MSKQTVKIEWAALTALFTWMIEAKAFVPFPDDCRVAVDALWSVCPGRRPTSIEGTALSALAAWMVDAIELVPLSDECKPAVDDLLSIRPDQGGLVEAVGENPIAALFPPYQLTARCEACQKEYSLLQGYYEEGEYSYCSECCSW